MTLPEQSVQPSESTPDSRSESEALSPATESNEPNGGRRRLASVVAALVALVVLVSVFLVLGRSGDSDDAAGRASSAKFGVFRGTAPAEVAEFAKWSGREVEYVIDYSTRTTWDEIANPRFMLDSWKGSGYRMVYATALLPTQEPKATIAAGARGKYDHYFASLANNLVEAGQGDAIIRLGWEFNLPESRWHPASSKNFVRYWRRVVTAMRAAPGAENLQFDWTVSAGSGGSDFDPRLSYPGSDYVDYIGVDLYDISWAANSYPFPANCDDTCLQSRREVAWKDKLDGPYGLNTWATFARTVGRPMSLPEWGLWKRPDGHGGGDNAYFIQQMLNFIADPRNNVAYQAYFEFDVGEGGTHELAVMPSAGSKFRELVSS